MDKIELQNIGRRFNQHWIFRHLDYTFHKGESYALLGANGSGKSTLLQLVSGALAPSEGTLLYHTENQNIDVQQVYQHLTLVAPYLEIFEEFTYQEALEFHFKFKPILSGYQISDVFDCLKLPTHTQREVKYFSSGMKQRLKLALAFFSDVPLLLLDEPTSNLDHQGEAWYQELFVQFSAPKIIIVSSNQEIEYQHCKHHLHINDYKIKKDLA